MNNSKDKYVIWAFANDGEDGVELPVFKKFETFWNQVLTAASFDFQLIIIDQNGLTIEEDRNTGQFLLGLGGITKICDTHENILITHGGQSIPHISKLHELKVIDYSRTDRNYPDMLDTFTNVDTRGKLFSSVRRWLVYYEYFKLVPIRRLKHRSLNLFAHINIDLQTLSHLWKLKEVDEFVHTCKSIKQQWSQNIVSHSPQKELERLWFLVVRDSIRENINVSDILLPSLGSYGEISLFEWLTMLPENQKILSSEEWMTFIEKCGLRKSGNSFAVNKNGEFLNLCSDIDTLMNNPLQEGKKIQNISDSFANWMNNLSSAFDDLNRLTTIT